MKDRLCQHGNCTIESTTVTVNYHNQERPSFCGAVHAALWLLEREGHSQLAVHIKKQMSEGK